MASFFPAPNSTRVVACMVSATPPAPPIRLTNLWTTRLAPHPPARAGEVLDRRRGLEDRRARSWIEGEGSAPHLRFESSPQPRDDGLPTRSVRVLTQGEGYAPHPRFELSPRLPAPSGSPRPPRPPPTPGLRRGMCAAAPSPRTCLLYT